MLKDALLARKIYR